MSHDVAMHWLCRFVRGHATTELALNNVGVGTRYLRTSDLLPDLGYEQFDSKHTDILPDRAVFKASNEAVVTIEGFARSDGGSTVGVACWKGEGLLNNHVVKVVSASSEVLDRFAMYSMLRDDNLERIKVGARGAISLSAGHTLESLQMEVPPLDEQRRIADFLDDQVALLDQAIALRQQQMILLREQHESFREERLLHPGAILTPVSALLATRISDGPHETPEWADDGVPFLSVDSVVDDQLNFDGCRFISANDHARYSLKSKPQYGDVLVTKAASIGKVAEVCVHFEFNVWSPLAILRPAAEAVSTSYLANVLRLRRVQSDLRLTSNTNTQANLSMSALGRVRVPYVSLSEQAAIAGAVHTHLKDMRTSESLLRRSHALLTERRQALITSAVTGQFDVTTARNVA